MAAAPAPNSVAVLYFDNLSHDTADAYLADGLTEDLIDRLGHIERLVVKSRTAVRRFRSRSIEDPGVLGRTLGVANLVSGSVRRSGGRLKITAELARAAAGTRVWGETYERADSDLMAVAADIAQAIATGVGGRLAPPERRSLGARSTSNAAAYEHFLLGNYLLARRNAADVRRAIEEYEAAVRLDPGFVRALGRVGLAFALFLDWGWPYPGLTAGDVLARGSAAVDRAVVLDSTDADAWLARGYLLSYRNPRTFEGVLAAFERAVALDPRNAEAHHQYGDFLFYIGEDAAAQTALHRALALEPERAITLDNMADVQRALHQYNEAEAMLDSAIAVDPTASYAYADKAWVQLFRGNLAGARASAQAAGHLAATETILAVLEARGGDTVAARARMARQVSQLTDPAHPRVPEGVWVAAGYAQLGDQEQALRILESVESRGIDLWHRLRDPMFDPLRGNPQFQHLVAESRPR